MSTPSHPRVTLRYEVERVRDDWTLPEEPVPESRPHDLVVELLRDLLVAWVARVGRPAQVGRNLAVRWDQNHPKVGVDPDVYVVEPKPPEGDDVQSLRLWEPGHHAPILAVEVVSSHPAKDYAIAPDKYAACGVGELWVLDPRKTGPSAHGGPFRIQIWRNDDDSFVRIYAGDGPARSPLTNGFLFVVDEGQRVRIAEDEDGSTWWMTREESERAAKEAALARVAELEQELKRRG